MSGRSFSDCDAAYIAAHAEWEAARRALAARQAAGFVLKPDEIDPACELAIQAVIRTGGDRARARTRNAMMRASAAELAASAERDALDARASAATAARAALAAHPDHDADRADYNALIARAIALDDYAAALAEVAAAALALAELATPTKATK